MYVDHLDIIFLAEDAASGDYRYSFGLIFEH